jgi:ABC-type bacteriocin/lantibiotic exporter with double-glycine peptidase domain
VRWIEQMEAAECGLVCIAMLLRHFGHHVPLAELRAVIGTSRDGHSAGDVLRAARALGLEGRGLRVPLSRLGSLSLPALLHWENNHFVVLQSVSRRGIRVVDPALGTRHLSHTDAGLAYSGVALELRPGPSFRRRRAQSTSLSRYRTALGAAKSTLVFVVLANVAGQCMALAFPASSQVLIDQVIVPARVHWLIPVLAVTVGAGILRLSLLKLQGASRSLLQASLGLSLTLELGRHLLKLPLPFLDSRNHGDLLGRVEVQQQLQELIANAVQACFDVVAALLLGALMVAYDWRMGSLGLLVAALRVLLVRALNPLSERRAAAVLAARGREQGALVEATRSPELTHGMGAQDRLSQRYARRVSERVRLVVASARLQQGLAVAAGCIGAWFEALILWYGGHRVIDGAMSIGVFSGFLAIRIMIEPPLQALATLLGSWAQMRGALARSDDVLSTPAVATGSLRPSVVRGRIEARNLGFRYGSGASWVLRGVHLVIEPGQKVAIIGLSGQGKSTLGRLLVGLLAPSEGEVLLDGAPLCSYDSAALARHLGVVLQDPLIMEGSVQDALRLRWPEAPVESLLAAARLACFDQLLARMPEGLDAPLLALGSNLSGGERQRLALAQALVGFPSVLLLDEATCALDATTEQQILSNLERLPATIVAIAHRPAVAEHAERVLCVRDGAVHDLHVATRARGLASMPAAFASSVGLA